MPAKTPRDRLEEKNRTVVVLRFMGGTRVVTMIMLTIATNANAAAADAPVRGTNPLLRHFAGRFFCARSYIGSILRENAAKIYMFSTKIRIRYVEM